MFRISFENLSIPNHLDGTGSIITINTSSSTSNMTAIIGNGREELLNAISGHSKLDVTGVIQLNGNQLSNCKKIKSISSFLAKKDIHYPTMTVREVLEMVYSLRGGSGAAAAAAKEIDSIIEKFDLSLVEGEKMNNTTALTPYHLKLVSLAIEKLSNTRIIFIENPFQYLERKNSLRMLEMLSNLFPGTMIFITMNDIDLLNRFDNIILLKDKKIPFSGSYDAFKKYSSFLKKEEGRNDNDEDPIKYLFMKRLHSSTPIDTFVQEDDKQHQQQQQTQPTETPQQPHTPSLWKQFKFLIKRNTYNIYRRRLYLLMMAFEAVFLGLVIGFVGIEDNENETRIDDIFNRIGALVFFSITSFTIGIIGILSIFTVEKEVIKKELRAKLYGPAMYLTTKVISDLPIQLLVPYTFVLVAYYIVGLNPAFSAYLMMGTLVAANALCGNAYGMLMSQLCDGNLFLVFELSPLVLTPFILVIFVITIPGYLVWIKYISPIYYCLSGLLQVEFTRSEPIPCNPDNEECFVNSEYYSYYWVFSSGVDLVFLFTIYFVLLILTYISLYLRGRSYRR